ncbi:hypothetical protein ACFQV2_21145 [Actinokineospora soli]|uniref:Uncharacterized protein n=1 Tax=Actinokineospora soli TaxID=1048753 RepID=A0ABW2TQL9_9PSEU
MISAALLALAVAGGVTVRARVTRRQWVLRTDPGLARTVLSARVVEGYPVKPPRPRGDRLGQAIGISERR